MLLRAAQWLAILFPATLLFGPAVAEVAAALISVLFLAHSATQRNWEWLRTPWFVALAGMCGMFAVSGLFSADPATSIPRAFLFLRFVLFAAALAFWAARDDRTQRRSLLVMTCAMVALAGDMLLEYASGHDILGHARQDLWGFVRLHGPFNKLHPGSTLVWITFPAIFFLLDILQRRAVTPVHRVGGLLFVFALAVFVMGMVYVSGERAAFLSCLLGLVLAVLIAGRLRALFAVFLAGGLLTLAVAIYMQPALMGMQIDRVKADVVKFQDTSYGRLWHSAWDIARDYPLVGVGTKQFRHVCPDPKYGVEGRAAPAVRCGLHPHNMYLEVLAETGLFSLILFFTAIGCWGRDLWRQRAQVAADPLLCGLVIACAIRFWPIASMPSHFTPWFASPLWFVVGLLLSRLATSRPQG